MRAAVTFRHSRVPWIGPIPSHWTTERLKFHLRGIEQGWSPQCDNIPAGVEEWGVLKAGCVNGPEFDSNENKRLPSNERPLEEFEVRDADVLMSRANTTGLLGSTALVRNTRPRLLLSDKLYRLDVNESTLCKEYLVAFLRCPVGRYEFERDATGASKSMQNIGQDSVLNLWLPVPPILEQRAIARYVDRNIARLDALVAAKERVLALLAEKRRSLITRAVTRGLDARVPLRDSGIPWLGEIPTHWAVWKVGHFAVVGNGSTPSRDNEGYWTSGLIPWLNSSVVNQDEVTGADQFVTESAFRECHLPLVRSGSILVGITGQGKTRGQAVVLSCDATINQHLAYITPKKGVADLWFVRWIFLAAYDFLRSISDDAGGTKGALTCEEVRAFRMPLPPIEEQRAIVVHIRAEIAKLTKLQAATERTIALLKERRAALIAAAVTGRLPIPGAA